MNKSFFKKIIFLSITLLLVGAFPFNTIAAEDTAVCNLTNKVAELNNLKNNNEIDYIEKRDAELELGKEVLLETINCAVQEAIDLKTELIKTSIKDRGLADLKTRLSADIDQAINYYRINQGGIRDLDSLGLKKLAQKILDWRTSNYNYIAGKVANLISWTNNQELFNVAENRFAQITKITDNLESSTDKAKFTLREAENSLSEAKQINEQARTDLISFNAPEVSLDLIQKSLEKLSNVYNGFSALSEELNKILPE